MKYLHYPTALLALSLLVLFGINANAQNTPTKPNIILFFIDDMEWQDTSEPFHTEATALNKNYFTPHMEQLADEGMKFTQAYACAVCSPSRVSLMTGQNAARHQVTNWTLRKNTSPDPKHPKIIPPTWNVNGLSAEPGIAHTVHAKTLPMYLRESGYRTIHAGKAHLGAADTPGENPINLGFDINIGGHAAGGPGSYYGKYNYSALWRDADPIWDVPGLEAYHGTETYLTEALTLEANKAITKSVEDKQPFYLYMSHYAIHAPWERDDRFSQRYLDKGMDDYSVTYASMLEGMDKSLGDIHKNVRQLGIENETILIFMTDNGALKQAPRNLPLRGHKLTPYEGGVRVPAIVKWPGKTKANTICHEYIIVEDLFPTILEMAGHTQPDDLRTDGLSFVSKLNGNTLVQQERPIYWHFPHTYDQPPYSAIRMGDWKLIYFYLDEHYELYNIAEDISESNNRWRSNKNKGQELAHRLGTYLREVNAPMPTHKKSKKQVAYPAGT